MKKFNDEPINPFTSCYGTFPADRTCQLCHHINPEYARECKDVYDTTNKMVAKIFMSNKEKLENCPHRHRTLGHDYEEYWGCMLMAKGLFLGDCTECILKEGK